MKLIQTLKLLSTRKYMVHIGCCDQQNDSCSTDAVNNLQSTDLYTVAQKVIQQQSGDNN